MAGVTGRELNIAFGKIVTNSWAVATSVTKGAYFEGDGGAQYSPVMIDDERFNQAFLAAAEVGHTNAVNASFRGQMRYTDQHYILEALTLGSPATVAISTSATGQTTSWLHVLDLAPNADGLACTFAVDKKLYVDEVTSAKLVGFGFEVGENGVLNETFEVLGSDVIQTSTINTRSTVHSATYPSAGTKVILKQASFRINAQAAAGLAAGDAVPVERFSFRFTRPQDAPFISGTALVAEPADNGFPGATLTVTYPRMNTVSANSLVTGLRANTAYKAEILAQGSYINSTDQQKFLIQMPHLEPRTFTNAIAGANQIKPVVEFACKLAASSPTGMAFVNPFRISRIMVNSVNAFA